MNEPEDVLATVRRAYRYVVAYERRVLDAIARVDDVLRDRGFEPEKYAYPIHTEAPTKRQVLTNWAWNAVPNYARRFKWLFGEENAAGSCWVLVDHVADTAFEKRRITRPGEPQPLGDDLVPVESSRSVLRWFVARSRRRFRTSVTKAAGPSS